MPRFTLDIDLGNEAMKSPEDVALALEKTAEQIVQGSEQIGGYIIDDNGNRVGFYEGDFR